MKNFRNLFTGNLQECRTEMDHLTIADHVARAYNGHTVAEAATYRVVVIDGIIYKESINEINRRAICTVENLRFHLSQRRKAHANYAWKITDIVFFAALDCIA